MRLLLRQRFFSWFDSFDIYNDAGAPVYTVQGKLSWGHKLEISDASGRYRGTVQERVLTFLPQFELYEGETYLGCIRREFPAGWAATNLGRATYSDRWSRRPA